MNFPVHRGYELTAFSRACQVSQVQPGMSGIGFSDIVASRAEKPVVVGEFGAQLPMADRIGIFQAIYDEILDAATDGLPAAGDVRPSAQACPRVPRSLKLASNCEGIAEIRLTAPPFPVACAGSCRHAVLQQPGRRVPAEFSNLRVSSSTLCVSQPIVTRRTYVMDRLASLGLCITCPAHRFHPR